MRGNKVILFYILLFSCLSATAQEPLQTIRGEIVDAYNEQALVGASIQILASDSIFGTTSDEQGAFRINNVAIGRYQVQVSYIGYETLLLPELLVESGKEAIINIHLREGTSELTTVEVNAGREALSLSSVSSFTMTVEETLRFPATFNDPARLAMAYPGIAGTSDQANHLSIRGNSPNSLAWQLEGVDIVNPNHLSNAGTFSDRPTRNGGGVNILSAQLLGNSTFFSGAFPAGYGNSLAGILDMRLRKGNSEQQEFMAQIGVIGLELAAEGPFSKSLKASYLINYRYSTLGLLSAFGVDLGDEAITFQDLAFNLNLPTKNAGRFTLFGMGGVSENVFEAQRDTAQWEFDKDRFDIRYESKMGAIGATHVLPIGQKGVWRTALAYSAQQAIRTADQLDTTFMTWRLESDDYLQSKLSLHSGITQKLQGGLLLRGGIFISQQAYDVEGFINTVPPSSHPATIEGDINTWLLQAYLSGSINFSDYWTLDAGLHLVHFSFTKSSSLEPRVALSWQPVAKHRLSLAYSLHSQQQRPELYFERGLGQQSNKDLGLTKSHHIELRYEYQANEKNRVKATIYRQDLFDVPIINGDNSIFSELNNIDDIRRSRRGLINEGTGRNYGIEINWQRYLSNDYYFLINTSLFDSKYTANGVERNTRFNSNYIVNATGGKEWEWTKRNKKRILGVNVRVNYRGGFRKRLIDEAASLAQGFTVYQEADYFENREKAYFKADLRIYYKNNKRGFSSTVALDIQNASNAENIAYKYYDLQQQAVVTEYQLGLIPILSYRIEF